MKIKAEEKNEVFKVLRELEAEIKSIVGEAQLVESRIELLKVKIEAYLRQADRTKDGEELQPENH